jgi:hypothetical protein
MTEGLQIDAFRTRALNGNIGIIKSMMGEMTDSTNIATAFGMMPLAWSTGSALGCVPYPLSHLYQVLALICFGSPVIGGSLSHPADRFPDMESPNSTEPILTSWRALFQLVSGPCLVGDVLLSQGGKFLQVFTHLSPRLPFVQTLPSPIPFSHLLISRSRSTLAAHDSLSRGTAPTGDSPATEGGHVLSHRILLTRRVIITAGNYASCVLPGHMRTSHSASVLVDTNLTRRTRSLTAGNWEDLIMFWNRERPGPSAILRKSA